MFTIRFTVFGKRKISLMTFDDFEGWEKEEERSSLFLCCLFCRAFVGEEKWRRFAGRRKLFFFQLNSQVTHNTRNTAFHSLLWSSGGCWCWCDYWWCTFFSHRCDCDSRLRFAPFFALFYSLHATLLPVNVAVHVCASENAEASSESNCWFCCVAATKQQKGIKTRSYNRRVVCRVSEWREKSRYTTGTQTAVVGTFSHLLRKLNTNRTPESLCSGSTCVHVIEPCPCLPGSQNKTATQKHKRHTPDSSLRNAFLDRERERESEGKSRKKVNVSAGRVGKESMEKRECEMTGSKDCLKWTERITINRHQQQLMMRI